MILSIGEILIDKIKGYKNGEPILEEHCGGAPFNVIYYANKQGAETAFVGALGNDKDGDFLFKFATKANLNHLSVQRINKPTTVALVENDINGERSFRFIRKDAADYQISYSDIDKNLLEKASIIHLGSLMLSEQKGRDLADKIVEYCHNNNKILSFDINFRSDIFASENEAKEIYKKYINAADILKVSEDELEIFTNIKDFESSVNKLKRKNLLLVVTLGSKGSYYTYNDSTALVETIKVKPVDTTGAGDSFYGTFLALLDKGVSFSDVEIMKDILRTCNKVAANTTLFKGAIQ